MASSSQSALLPLDSMTLRPVEPRDFAAIATLSTAAMMEDDLIDYICPYRHKHPESLRQYFLRSVKQRYYSVDEHALAVEVPDADDTSQKGSSRMKLVGHAAWRRDGDGEKAQVWRKKGSWADTRTLQIPMSLNAVFERQALRLTNHYISIFHLDRSVSRSRLAEADALKDHFSDVLERWHLTFLVVHPDFQRRGVGGCLVEWGTENAKKEGIPATILGSQVGQSMYRKKGFKDYKLSWLKEGVHAMAMIYIPEGTTITEIDTRALELQML